MLLKALCGAKHSPGTARFKITRHKDCGTIPCNRSCWSGCDPFVCLFSRGIRDTSGEAAFPRPRLGQVLTPLGVNIIALARNVIRDYVKLNCYICQSAERQFIWLRDPWLWSQAKQA